MLAVPKVMMIGVHPPVGDEHAVDQAEHAADGHRQQDRRQEATAAVAQQLVATTTAQTMTTLPTETSMPPVMMTMVMPTPIRATGAIAHEQRHDRAGGEERPAWRSARTSPEHGDHARSGRSPGP